MDRRTAKATRWRISYFHNSAQLRVMGTVYVHAATSTLAIRKAMKHLVHHNVDQVWAEPR